MATPKRIILRKPAPACPQHGVAMKVASTYENHRRFVCPVPGCHQSRIMERDRASEEKLLRKQ